MIPVEPPRRASAPFPFVGLAVAVLMLYAVLVAIFPPNVYRTAVAIATFFAMGYCILALVVGRAVRLSAPEVLGFTVGLTILFTSLAALAVSSLGVPITEFAVIILGLPVGLLAWYLRRPQGGSWTAFLAQAKGLFDFSDYSQLEKLTAGVLLAAIAVALVALVALSTVNFPDRLSPALAIDGPDGTPNTLPTLFVRGQPGVVVVSALGGSTSGNFTVRIRLIPTNATGTEPFHVVPPTTPLLLDAFAEAGTGVTLAPGATWTQPFSIQIEKAGSFELRFDLLDSGGAVVAGTHLFVQAT